MKVRSVKILMVSCAAVTLIVVASVHSLSPKLIWNSTNSAPTGLYRIDQRDPKLGEFALVAPGAAAADLIQKRGYLPLDIPLVKRVSARAGDEICRENQAILINKIHVADALMADSLGQELPQWRGCFTLQSDEVFLLNNHEKSLDGRYFGATNVNDVIGVAIPVWVTAHEK